MRRSKRLTARQRRALLRAFDDDARKLEARFEAELLRSFNALGREAARAMREATRPINYNYQSEVLHQILVERELQDRIWGHALDLTHDDSDWALIITSHIGNLCEVMLNSRNNPVPTDIETEIIQLAAVALAWLETRKELTDDPPS